MTRSDHSPVTAYAGAAVFDGTTLHSGVALVVADGRVSGLAPKGALPETALVHHLPGGVLAPGFVDLQVNGGGGVMFNDAPGVATLRTMIAAHNARGSAHILPTLISDDHAHLRAAISAVSSAVRDGVKGIAGLHLEGPHLSPARKGAHDSRYIRPMEATDLALLCDAAQNLPALLITLAPEAVSPEQINTLSGAGAIVSLGHTNAGYDTCHAAVNAGARMTTHLFNAMSQLGNREPGLVGATLDLGGLSAGLIADGIHVHPRVIAAALRAKTGPGKIFLVSDAMAQTNTNMTEFLLNGRRILRRDGRLTLEDGTLAGADLDLARAVEVMTRQVGHPLPQVLSMATSTPAGFLSALPGAGHLRTGDSADMVWLDDAFSPAQIWRGGVPLQTG